MIDTQDIFNSLSDADIESSTNCAVTQEDDEPCLICVIAVPDQTFVRIQADAFSASADMDDNKKKIEYALSTLSSDNKFVVNVLDRDEISQRLTNFIEVKVYEKFNSINEAYSFLRALCVCGKVNGEFLSMYIYDNKANVTKNQMNLDADNLFSSNYENSYLYERNKNETFLEFMNWLLSPKVCRYKQDRYTVVIHHFKLYPNIIIDKLTKEHIANLRYISRSQLNNEYSAFESKMKDIYLDVLVEVMLDGLDYRKLVDILDNVYLEPDNTCVIKTIAYPEYRELVLDNYRCGELSAELIEKEYRDDIYTNVFDDKPYASYTKAEYPNHIGAVLNKISSIKNRKRIKNAYEIRNYGDLVSVVIYLGDIFFNESTLMLCSLGLTGTETAIRNYIERIMN